MSHMKDAGLENTIMGSTFAKIVILLVKNVMISIDGVILATVGICYWLAFVPSTAVSKSNL